MKKDNREDICAIISKMLDNPDGSGIYPTSTAYTELERLIVHLVVKRVFEAIGWCYSWACTELDSGNDPRTSDVSEMLEKAKRDLSI